MARFALSGRTTVVGTNLRPNVSLYATTGVRPIVREIGVTNTTAVACCVGVARLTAAGTQGAALTEQKEGNTTHVAIATGFAGHTVDLTAPQISDNEHRRATLGAAVGSGMVWVFGDNGLEIPHTTADGVGIFVPTGTGQILDYWLVWDE